METAFLTPPSLSLSAQLILSASKDEWIRFVYSDYLIEQSGGEGIELSDPLWIMGDKGYSDGCSYDYSNNSDSCYTSDYGSGCGSGYGYRDGDGYGCGYTDGYGDGYGYGDSNRFSDGYGNGFSYHYDSN